MQLCCRIVGKVEVLCDPWAILLLRAIMFGNHRHFRELVAGSEEVMMRWVREFNKAGLAIDSKTFIPKKGPRPLLPKRWVVERTFSWLSQSRRLSKDYERLPESSEAFIYAAMSRLMARRLARS